MTDTSARSAPAPGQAPLVAANAAALLRRNAEQFGDRVAIKFGDRTLDARRVLRRVVPVRRAVPRAAARPDAPRHVAVLLDNTPDYLFAFGGAALIGGGDRRAQPHAPRRAPAARRRAHALRARDHRAAARGAARADRRPAARRSLSSSRFADADDPPSTLGASLADALAAHAARPIPASSPTSTRSGR